MAVGGGWIRLIALAAAARASEPPSQPKRFICWFRDDLRVHDNPVLAEAASCRAQIVLPVYIFDPRQHGLSMWGSQKSGAYRARFLLESVKDLRSSLRALGSDLLVGVGHPEQLLPLLVDPDHTTTLLWQEQSTAEALELDAAVGARMPSATLLQPIWSGTLLDPHELFLPDRSDLPATFRDFRRLFDALTELLAAPLAAPTHGSLPYERLALPEALPEGMKLGWSLLPTPAMLGLQSYATQQFLEGKPMDAVHVLADPLFSPQTDKRSAMHFRGGETEARAQLIHVLWGSDCFERWYERRDKMPAPGEARDQSTKLSPWLAHGCISAREIAAEARRFVRAKPQASKSLYWLTQARARRQRGKEAQRPKRF